MNAITTIVVNYKIINFTVHFMKEPNKSDFIISTHHKHGLAEPYYNPHQLHTHKGPSEVGDSLVGFLSLKKVSFESMMAGDLNTGPDGSRVMLPSRLPNLSLSC